MRSRTIRYYNEMGDGYDEVVLLEDVEAKRVTVIHVGKFYNNAPSTVDVTNMDQKGYRKDA